MSFYIGGIVILIPFFIFLLFCPSEEEDPHWETLYSGIDTYYFCASLIFVLYCTGFAIQVFRRFNINYVFIFELNQVNEQLLIHH